MDRVSAGILLALCTCVCFPADGQENNRAAEPVLEFKSHLGIQQSQASSASRVWKITGNLGINANVTKATRFFVDLDLTSVPQQVNFNVSQAPTQVTALVKNLNVNQAVQSVNLLVGGEFGPNRPVKRGSVIALKGVAMAGFSTPLASSEAVQIYNSTQDAFNQLKINASPTVYPYLVLTTPDRSRFYFQHFYGARVKFLTTHGDDKYSDAFNGSRSNAPGYFDVTFGQNAAVTGGALRGCVWRASAFLPIPYTQGLFSIFGNSFVAIKKNINSTPLFLSPASITLPNQQAYVFAKAEDRDFYQLGVAMDTTRLVSKAITKLTH